MTMPIWMKDALDQGGMRYEERHHRAAYTAQEVAAAEHVSGHRLAKVVVAMADGRPVELVLPASRRVDLARLRQALGAGEVRLASEAEIEKIFPDCEVGAIPPLGHCREVPVLMDPALKVEGDIIMQAGTHEDAVRVRYEDWFALVHPRVASFTAEAALA
jgi:Ala-tRNA(Pro) deacylase